MCTCRAKVIVRQIPGTMVVKILGSNSSLEEDSAVKDGDTVLVKKGIEEDGEWEFKARILQDSLGDDGEWL